MNQPVAERGTLPTRSASIAVLLVFASLGTLLGLVAAGDNVLRFDVTVLDAAQRIDLPGLDVIVRLSNAVFDTVGALVLAVLFVIAAMALGRRVFAVQLVLVVLLRLVGQVLKPIFASPRPGLDHQPDPSLVSSTFGYPSGHAYTATVMMEMFVLFVCALEVPRWVRGAIIGLAIVGVVGAMFSRVSVGAHWPTDTIGGVCYGLATVALMQLIVGAILNRIRARSELRP